MTRKTPEQIAAEREWLIDLLLERPLGKSAQALVLCCVTGTPPKDYPHDLDDYSRCERIAAKAPTHLQSVVTSILSDFWRRVHP